MRKLFNIAVLIIGMTLTCHAQNSSSSSPNLIKNGSFTKGRKGWNCERHNDRVKMEVEKGYLRFWRKGPYTPCRVFQDVKVQPGGVYEISFRAKQAENSRYMFWLIFKTEKKKWLEQDIVYIKPEKVSLEWENISKIIKVPNDVNLIRINFRSQGKNATVLFDDICFKKISNANKKQNLLVPQLSDKLKFDGLLKEDFWKTSLTLKDFKILGKPTKKSKEKTEIKLAVIDDQLLIGIKAFDNIKKLRTSSIGDGFYVFNDENIEIFLCPEKSSKQKKYIHLAINPKAFKASERKGADGKFLPWWGSAGNDIVGDWEAKTYLNRNSWTAEIKLPLSCLFKKNLNGKVDLYGNFCRHKPGEKEPYSNWAGLSGKSFHVPGAFPKLTLDLKTPINLGKNKNKLQKLEFSKKMQIPDILTVGKPVKIEKLSGAISLPGTIEFDIKGLNINAELRKQIATIMANSKGAKQKIRCSLLQVDDLKLLTKSEKQKMTSPEAFVLKISKDGFDIKGKNRDGVLRALATLVMIVKNEIYKGKNSIPCVKIWDAPGFKIRGWLITGDTPAKLKPQIDILYLLRCNVVQFEVSGYGKTGPFPFESIPEINNGKTTKKQWKDLADYARARGIRPVPIYFTWSRAGFILNRDKYVHLAERPDLRKGARLPRAHDRNFCAVNPVSCKLLFTLLEEIIDTMKLKDLHIGHDEIHHDDVSVSKLAVEQKRTRKDWIVDTVVKTNEFCRKKGVRLWIYADCLDPGHSGRYFGIFSKRDFQNFNLPKDVFLQDWKYETGNHPSIAMFKSSGYTTIASCWESIPALSDLIRDTYFAKADGHIGTSWSSTVTYAILPEMTTMIALGAYLSWSPQEYDLKSIPVQPAYYYHLAAMKPVMHTIGKTIQIKTPKNAISGKKLISALGFPANTELSFLQKKIMTAQGVNITPFTIDGQPAAVLVKGNKQSKTIPVNAKAKAIFFLHTDNAQKNLSMHGLAKKYRSKLSGKYLVKYTDGTETAIPLTARKQVTWWNDRHAAMKTEPGLFGTLSGQLHVNIPVLHWDNKFPNKEIASIEVKPGNKDKLDLILFGVSLRQ